MNNEIINSIDQLKQIASLQDPFSVKQQIKLVKKISRYPKGFTYLLELLIARRFMQMESLQYIDGIIFKHLHNSKVTILRDEVGQRFHEGIVALESSNNINYRPLYKSLISNNFRTANQLTQQYLHALAGIHKDQKRQWLYFTDILSLPIQDIKTIDALWTIYSEGRFGFSIQKQVWMYNNKNWEKFWHKIGWKINKKNMRYPNEFIWDTTAPAGHLPLFNQLRGAQVLAALFMHPALKDTND